jgi:hypothetical protein
MEPPPSPWPTQATALVHGPAALPPPHAHGPAALPPCILLVARSARSRHGRPVQARESRFSECQVSSASSMRVPTSSSCQVPRFLVSHTSGRSPQRPVAGDCGSSVVLRRLLVARLHPRSPVPRTHSRSPVAGSRSPSPIVNSPAPLRRSLVPRPPSLIIGREFPFAFR